jgi:hypothetical protein
VSTIDDLRNASSPPRAYEESERRICMSQILCSRILISGPPLMLVLQHIFEHWMVSRCNTSYSDGGVRYAAT